MATTYRILIVDDQRDVRRLLRAGLETLGPHIKVIDVPSGEEAMLVLPGQSIDLMVADVRLPGITGLELKERALTYNPNLKLILVTGMTDPKVKQKVMDAGADAFFFKPVEMEEFLSSVEYCLGLIESKPVEPVVSKEELLQKELDDRLSNLMNGLKAAALLLIDGSGSVLGRAGEVQEGNDESVLISDLLDVFSAGTRVSQWLGVKLPENLLYFRGARHDLFLAYLTENIYLLILTTTTTPGINERAGKVLPMVRPALPELLSTLVKMGVASPTKGRKAKELKEPGGKAKTKPLAAPTAPTEVESKAARNEATPEVVPEVIPAVIPEVPPEEVAELMPGLDLVFNKEAKKGAKAQDLDAFWDTLSEQNNPDKLINADAIPYDEALKLGLAPDPEEDDQPS